MTDLRGDWRRTTGSPPSLWEGWDWDRAMVAEEGRCLLFGAKRLVVGFVSFPLALMLAILLAMPMPVLSIYAYLNRATKRR